MSEAVGRTTADLLRAGLDALGVQRIFGAPLAGLPVAALAEPVLADALADADGRTGRMGASSSADGALRLSSQPGAEAERVRVSDPGSLAEMLATVGADHVPTALEIDLDLDLDAPLPADVAPLGATATPEPMRLAADLAGLDVVVIVGPGVHRAGAQADLETFAHRTGWPVFNTFGAKGVFAWDDPFHAGTVGLQARDGELAGLDAALILVTVGIDPHEMPGPAPGGTPVTAQELELVPGTLAATVAGWPEDAPVPARTRLYEEVAAAVGPLYADDRMPLNPAAAARDLADVVPAGALVAADPGPAGLWVARTYPTPTPDAVVVPSLATRGFAAAAALVGALDGRPTVGVTTDPVDDETRALLELARQLDLNLTLEVWAGDGGPETADARRTTLLGSLNGGGVDVLAVPVDFTMTRRLVEVAGEVVAWTD